MSKPSKPVNGDDPNTRQDYGVDDRGVPIWGEDDENIVSGRNWTMILVFVFVPLMALVVLALCLFALFIHVFNPPQAVEIVVERSDRIA